MFYISEGQKANVVEIAECFHYTNAHTAQAAGPGSHLAGAEGNEFSCLVFVAAGSRLASLWLLHLSWRISQPDLTLRVFGFVEMFIVML